MTLLAFKKKKKTEDSESAQTELAEKVWFSSAFVVEAAAQGALRAAISHRGAGTQHPIGWRGLSRHHRQNGHTHHCQVPEVRSEFCTYASSFVFLFICFFVKPLDNCYYFLSWLCLRTWYCSSFSIRLFSNCPAFSLHLCPLFSDLRPSEGRIVRERKYIMQRETVSPYGDAAGWLEMEEICCAMSPHSSHLSHIHTHPHTHTHY